MMTKNNALQGHLAAFLTIFIWGTTFISTKVLLKSFGPIEILFIRFLIGYLALWIGCPRRKRKGERKEELYFAVAGLCGVTLYFLLENIALTYTYASNVGVIISIAPFFTAIFSFLLKKEERPGKRFFLGFLMAMAGIFLISGFGGLNPFGDLLAVGAAILWAAYSLLTRKISDFGYPVVQATRRTFFYGLVFMIPALFLMDFHVDPRLFWEPANAGNLLFLGLGASALCFVTWNFAVRVLGSIKTSVYIYMVPVVTTVTSALILDEKITAVSAVGILLTLGGLFLSQKWGKEEGDSLVITEEIRENSESI